MKLQIGVKVLIKNSHGNYLFIKRTDLLQNETETSWDIPGGRIEPEESLPDALRREVKEELDIDLTGEPVLVNAQDIFVPAKDLHVVRLTYTLTADIETINLSDEHQEFTWVSPDTLSTLNLEPFLKETLARL